MLTLTELFHGTLGQISTIASYNVVRKAKTKDHLIHELNRYGCVTLTNWLCLNPHCEFVNRHQEMGLFIFGPFESPTISIPQTANGQAIGIILNS